MTSQYPDGPSPEGNALPQSSEETTRSEGEHEEQSEPDIADLLEQMSSTIEARLSARFEHLINRQTDFTKSQMDRLANQVNREIGGNRESLEMVREWVEDSLTDEQRKALKDRSDLRRMRANEATPAAQQEQVRTESSDDPGDRYYAEIAPDLEDYARLKGFSEAEMTAATWMDRLAAAGAPQQLDWTPRGIRAYKDSMKRAMDKVAADAHAARRPQTRTPNPVTAGSGPKNYNNVAVKDIPDEEFTKNLAAVTAAVVAKNRR